MKKKGTMLSHQRHALEVEKVGGMAEHARLPNQCPPPGPEDLAVRVANMHVRKNKALCVQDASDNDRAGTAL